MATADSSLLSHDHTTQSTSDDSTLSAQNRRSFTNNTNSSHPRPGQHLDDADLLAWKRQYANIGLREKNTISNSADDLSQLDDRLSYQFEVFGQDYNDMEDDEIHFDNGNNYDYEADIHERLKKANEEFEHDVTPAELKHRQRVSFDAMVKAVDIVQDPQEHVSEDTLIKPSVSPVDEEPAARITTSQNDDSPVAYTVPLNDTQPKEGPTLLQQLKAMQFHGVPPTGDRWSSVNSNKTNGSSPHQGSPPLKSDSNSNTDTPDMASQSAASSKKSMLVSINGGFELQNEEDYVAKGSTDRRRARFAGAADDDDDDKDEDNDKKASTQYSNVRYFPKPPSEAKPPADPSKPQPPTRPYPVMSRPQSSDSGKRPTNSASTLSRSLSDNKNQSSNDREQRPKSAVVPKYLYSSINNPPSGVNFEELCQKAAEKKRAEMKEERRKKKEEEEKRVALDAKAKAKYEQWIHDKDNERKRLNEEKRMENDEREALRIKHEKELEDLRKKKFDEWSERKKREVMIVNEFRKLQAEEEAVETNGSSSSIHHPNQRPGHRAFKRWLRRKDEQSKEEKRQLRLETRRLRRMQRRSIKRYQLQQDLQLAKSFGYS
ncbi:unnamed protein product [Rotaria socialis]|uniref:Coiled-coil domain-containing protein 181 n=2 Tax=Rotaria socialis TaxID=392032 RepID=A0A817VEL7_9BILA|nr:unnamed protein product [Rotaria socialis]CAF3393374.1 unnamed protein product [Rotaria socialis]CAF3580781.1 unnamed protein product [Rotaria socialis]CAF4206102.1 unnamed protein product [Rotaria socialis]CAF4353775.1 unnamed protein product [Rotaria socialis]